MNVRELMKGPLFWTVVGVVLLGLVVVGLLVAFRPRVPVPAEVRRQLNFSLLYPDGSAGFTADQNSMSFSAQSKVLIFHARRDGNDLTITEQATPDPFNDIPEYYPKLVEKLHGYSDFESAQGKVSLTRPQELKGGQSAIFNGKGTLIFVHPEHDLSNEDWRRFFNSLILVKR